LLSIRAVAYPAFGVPGTWRFGICKPDKATMKGFMYILLCANGQYYTGSTRNLEERLAQHQNGEGANFTRKNLPVSLVYYEEFSRIDHAFYREKQVQGWSRKKKEALINGQFSSLPHLSRNYSQFGKPNLPEGADEGDNTAR
jgi:putative endonuclease